MNASGKSHLSLIGKKNASVFLIIREKNCEFRLMDTGKSKISLNGHRKISSFVGWAPKNWKFRWLITKNSRIFCRKKWKFHWWIRLRNSHDFLQFSTENLQFSSESVKNRNFWWSVAKKIVSYIDRTPRNRECRSSGMEILQILRIMLGKIVNFGRQPWKNCEFRCPWENCKFRWSGRKKKS